MEISEAVDFKISSKELWRSFHNLIFYTSAKYYLWYSDCYQLLMMSHLALYFLSPLFQLQETLHGSEMQKDVKKHVLWLITPKTCWEHRHYVMPDRVLLHEDINSSLFVSTPKWIGRLLLYSFSVRSAVSSFMKAIWGKQALGPQKDDVTYKEPWQGRVDYIKNLSYLLANYRWQHWSVQ